MMHHNNQNYPCCCSFTLPLRSQEGLWGQCYDLRINGTNYNCNHTENTIATDHPNNFCSGPKDVMNWYSAQAECQKYGMSMLRISGAPKVIISDIVFSIITMIY